MPSKTFMIALGLEDFRNLVAGRVVRTVTTPDYCPVHIILSDIGFAEMVKAVKDGHNNFVDPPPREINQ